MICKYKNTSQCIIDNLSIKLKYIFLIFNYYNCLTLTDLNWHYTNCTNSKAIKAIKAIKVIKVIIVIIVIIVLIIVLIIVNNNYTTNTRFLSPFLIYKYLLCITEQRQLL